MIPIDPEEKVNLEDVYNDLSHLPIIPSSKTRKEFKLFAKLLATKASFSSYVHKTFSKLLK